MQLFHLTRSAVIQIAKTVQWLRSRKIGNDMPVLGLAGCHWRKWKLVQVRPAGYPISLVASLDTVPVKCCVPLRENWKKKPWRVKPNKKCTENNGKKFYIYSDGPHTHTLPQECGKIKVRTMKWKWRGREMKMRWRWKWDESYLTRTQRGERKRRRKEKTPTHEA